MAPVWSYRSGFLRRPFVRAGTRLSPVPPVSTFVLVRAHPVRVGRVRSSRARLVRVFGRCFGITVHLFLRIPVRHTLVPLFEPVGSWAMHMPQTGVHSLSDKKPASAHPRFRSLSDPETLAKFAQNLGEGIY